MEIILDAVYERDMDFLFMRKLAQDKDFVRHFFLTANELAQKGYDKADFSVEKVAHSVMTEDGESDIEVVISIVDKKVALLIEDKIDAIAMPEQSARYSIRGQKAIERGDYDEFYVFVIAPNDYLSCNAESKKYANRISYEDIRDNMDNEFEKAVIDHSLSKTNLTRLPRNADVTAFWDRLYDYLEKYYPKVFQVHGHKGLERSGKPGQWISISCASPYSIQIKSDRGYADLEISGYAEKFSEFSEDNKALIDEEQLYIRTASKSLAIREYIPMIDFTQSFDSQIPALNSAFDAAKRLQDLISKLKINKGKRN